MLFNDVPYWEPQRRYRRFLQHLTLCLSADDIGYTDWNVDI